MVGGCAIALAGLLVAAGVQAQGYATSAKTKFGTLSVGPNQVLQFNGKPVQPEVVGRSGLAIEQTWDMGDQVWALVDSFDGGNCPQVLHVITMDARGAKASPTIASCSEIKDVQMVNQSLVINVEGDGAKESHKYVYAHGTLTDNGRVVPHGLNLYAVINDPDGYTNVRQAPNGKSPIVARVDKSEFFFTNPQRGDWWKVRLGSHQEGYMHKSRIVIVDGY